MNVEKRTNPLSLVSAAIQPVVYSWIMIAVVAILSYVLKADSPALGETSWHDVAQVATGWWLTAFGGTLHVDGTTVTLPPLLLTLIVFGGMRFFVRRVPILDWKDVAILTLSAAGVVILIGFLAPEGSNMWRAGLGAGALAIITALSSRNRTDCFGRGFFVTTAGRYLYDGFMIAKRSVLILTSLALVGLIIVAATNTADIARIQNYFVLDGPSTVFIWIFQLLYLPVLVIWSAQFMTAAGFMVGTGTHFSALGVTSAPLPAIPVFGLLPSPGTHLGWLVAVVVVIGFAIGMWQVRAFPTLKEAAISGAIGAVVTGVLSAILAAISTGAIGPERMSQTGGVPPIFALATILCVGLPVLLGMVCFHPSTRAFISGKATDSRERLAKAREERRAAKADAASGHDTDEMIDAEDSLEAGVTEDEVADDVEEDGEPVASTPEEES